MSEKISFERMKARASKETEALLIKIGTYTYYRRIPGTPSVHIILTLTQRVRAFLLVLLKLL